MMKYFSRIEPRFRYIVSLPLVFAFFIYLFVKASEALNNISLYQLTLIPHYIILAVISQMVGVFLGAWVWHRILLCFGVQNSYCFDFRVFTISAVARKIPGSIWYAMGRVFLYNRAGAPTGSILKALAWEAAITSIAGLILCTIAAYLILSDDTVTPRFLLSDKLNLLIFLVIIFLILLIVSITPKTKDFVKKITRGVQNSKVNLSSIILWIMGESVVIVLASSVLFLTANSINPSIPISSFTTILAAFSLYVALGPIFMWLPSDIGLRDGLAYLALDTLLSTPIAALTVLVWRALVTTLEIAVGVLNSVIHLSYEEADDRNSTPNRFADEV